MSARRFTLVILVGEQVPSVWAQRVAKATHSRLITSSQVNEEAAALAKKDIDRHAGLSTQLDCMREGLPKAEKEVLLRHGVGQERVLFYGIPGYYPLTVDGWIIDLSSLQPNSRPIDPNEDRRVFLRRLAEARHAIAAEARTKSTPREIHYLPSRLSDEERIRQTLRAMEEWHLI